MYETPPFWILDPPLIGPPPPPPGPRYTSSNNNSNSHHATLQGSLTACKDLQVKISHKFLRDNARKYTRNSYLWASVCYMSSYSLTLSETGPWAHFANWSINITCFATWEHICSGKMMKHLAAGQPSVIGLHSSNSSCVWLSRDTHWHSLSRGYI